MNKIAYQGIAYHLKEIAIILKERFVILVYNMLYIGDPEFDNYPLWKKILVWLFVLTLPIIGSINDFNF